MIREYIYFVDDNPNGTSGMTEEEIIRCKDCKYCDINITISKSVTGEVVDVNECIRFHKYVDEDDYCSFAVRNGE